MGYKSVTGLENSRLKDCGFDINTIYKPHSDDNYGFLGFQTSYFDI